MPDFTAMLLVMAAAALVCRMGGYRLMAWLPASPRIEAALRATPLSVMAGITALAVMQGELADALALAGVVGLTLASRNDVLSALCGVALV
jgi:uncharacterized membrane protein